MAKKYLRFRDLVERQIVGNRVTLGRWIKLHGFPPGVKIGPNSRAWTDEEIVAWQERKAAEARATEREVA